MSKAATDRNQRQLLELLKLPGNNVCADCESKNPRWTAWNHGVFVCVQCAGIHRKMGTDVSRVKSVSLDTWTKEQVERMRQRGNVVSNAELNPGNAHRPPQSSIDEGERESQLEKFIRNKYEHRVFGKAVAKEAPSRQTGSASSSPVMSFTAAPGPQQPAPLRAQTLPPPLIMPDPDESIDTFDRPASALLAPDGPKHVRFRAASVPNPDHDVPLRVPTPSAHRSPTKGILRPRSASGSPTISRATLAVGTGQQNGPPGTNGIARAANFGPSLNPFLRQVSTDPMAAPVSNGSALNGSSSSYSQSPLAASTFTAGTAFSASPAPTPPPEPAKGIWDDLGWLDMQPKRSNSMPLTTPAASLPIPQPPPQPPAQPAQPTRSYTAPSPQPPAPAPLAPQRTGFVPSSDFGRQLLTEFGGSSPSAYLSPQGIAGGPTPTSAGSSPGLSPLQPQSTGYSSGVAPSESQISHRHQAPTANAGTPTPTTNPFFNLSTMANALPSPVNGAPQSQLSVQAYAQSPSPSPTNPFFAMNGQPSPSPSPNSYGYEQQQQAYSRTQYQAFPVQPQYTGYGSYYGSMQSPGMVQQQPTAFNALPLRYQPTGMAAPPFGAGVPSPSVQRNGTNPFLQY